MGIEAKAPGRTVYENQWRRGIDLLRSNGRFIVATDDFDLDLVDSGKVKPLYIKDYSDIEKLDLTKKKITDTLEIVLKD